MIPVSLSEICRILGVEFHGEDTVISGISTDSRTVKGDELFVPIKGETFDAHDFIPKITDAAATLTEYDCGETPFPQIRVKSAVEALGIIGNSNFVKSEIPLTVTLTGSVGKTTTKDMCALVLSTKYNTFKTQGNKNNHVGLPQTLLSLDPSCEAFVCEMGMNHSGEISYLCRFVTADISIITNICNSHIENLGSRENIARAKLEILECLKPDGTLIVNGDEPLLDGLDISQRIVRVGMSDKNDVWADNIETAPDGVTFDCHVFGKTASVRLPIPGRHNVFNALFALALGELAGADLEAAAASLGEYEPSGMRQRIYEKSGCTVIADCYNASVEAMLASLEALRDMSHGRFTVAVLGDMREVGEKSEQFHRAVGRKVRECGVSALLCHGEDIRYTVAEAEVGEAEVRFFDSKEALAEGVLQYIDKNPIILFKAARGMEFEKVIELAHLTQD